MTQMVSMVFLQGSAFLGAYVSWNSEDSLSLVSPHKPILRFLKSCWFGFSWVPHTPTRPPDCTRLGCDRASFQALSCCLRQLCVCETVGRQGNDDLWVKSLEDVRSFPDSHRRSHGPNELFILLLPQFPDCRQNGTHSVLIWRANSMEQLCVVWQPL